MYAYMLSDESAFTKKWFGDYTYTTLLCEVALTNNIEMIDYLVSKGADPNVIFVKGAEPENIMSRLVLANDFDERSILTCKLLIKHGITLISEKFSLLHVVFSRMAYEWWFDELARRSKALKDVIGNDLFFHLLFIRHGSDSERPALHRLRMTYAGPEINNYFLKEIVSYFEKNKEKISNSSLMSLLLFTGDFTDLSTDAVEFVKKFMPDTSYDCDALAVPETPPSGFIEKIKSGLPKVLFGYQNEINAFTYCLESSAPISFDFIIALHNISLKESENSGVGNVILPLIFQYEHVISVSPRGFIELKEAEKKQGYFKIEKQTQHYKKSSSFITNYYIGSLRPRSESNDLKDLISNYHSDMSLLVGVMRLKRIIKFSSDLARLQYFSNANKRTAYIILNSELVKNGYIPTILKERVVLVYFSQSEIFTEVMKGMRLFIEHNKVAINEHQDESNASGYTERFFSKEQSKNDKQKARPYPEVSPPFIIT